VNIRLILLGTGLVAGVLSGPSLIAWDRPAVADAIVVIGGDHKPERVWWTVDLYKRGYAPVLIISGGTVVFEGDEWITEAEMMRRYARIWGVPDEAIILEERSQSTVENAQFCQEICSSRGYQTILLVTSPYHSRRARRTFRDELGTGTTVLVQPALQGFFKLFWWRYPDHVLVVLYEYQHRLRELWTGIVGLMP